MDRRRQEERVSQLFREPGVKPQRAEGPKDDYGIRPGTLVDHHHVKMIDSALACRPLHLAETAGVPCEEYHQGQDAGRNDNDRNVPAQGSRVFASFF